MSAKEKVKIKFNVKNLTFLIAIVSLLIIIGFAIGDYFSDDKVYMIFSTIFSCIATAIFSVSGLTFLIECTTLNTIAEKSMNSLSDKIVDKTSQADYIKKTYNKDAKRELLYLSYLDEYSFDGVEEVKKLALDSFEKIVEKLIKSVFLKKDEMITTYSFEKENIIKNITRRLELSNPFGEDSEFLINMLYYNLPSSSGKEVEKKKLKIDNKEEDIEMYMQKQESDLSLETSYSEKMVFKVPMHKNENRLVEYEMTIKIPRDDTSLFVSKYLAKNFRHTIICNKNEEFNKMDVSIFSLVNSIEEKAKPYHIEKVNETNNCVIYSITCDSWIFPGDGYNIQFKKG